MIKSIIAILGSIFLWVNICLAGEINYYNKSWSAIKEKAKKEHKYIFIDAYTSWCGWCKVMDKETMKDNKVIDFLNNNFVSVKMDMEHGEGNLLSMKYHIMGYPTFMFFNPDGIYVYKSMGYQNAEDFLKELTNALDKSKQFVASGFSNDINIDFPEFYKKAYAENGKREVPKPEVISSYLDGQKDLFSEINWGILSRFDLKDKYTGFFLDHLDNYANLYGRDNVEGKLKFVLNTKLQEAIKEKSDTKLSDLLNLTDKYVKDDPEGKKIYYRITYLGETKQWSKQAEAIEDFVTKSNNKNVSFLNGLCWNLYEQCDNSAVLKQACTWMANVIKSNQDYAYLDTYAALLYKSGNKKDAEIWANKAIDIGTKAGEKVDSTRLLLEKIRQEK